MVWSRYTSPNDFVQSYQGIRNHTEAPLSSFLLSLSLSSLSLSLALFLAGPLSLSGDTQSHRGPPSSRSTLSCWYKNIFLAEYRKVQKDRHHTESPLSSLHLYFLRVGTINLCICIYFYMYVYYQSMYMYIFLYVCIHFCPYM